MGDDIKKVSVKISERPIPKENIRTVLCDNEIGLSAKGLYFLLATTHDPDPNCVYTAKSLTQFTKSAASTIITALVELYNHKYLDAGIDDQDNIVYIVK